MSCHVCVCVCVCVYVCMCVCVSPHGTTRLTLEGFLLNLTFDYFSKYVDAIQFSLILTRITGKFT